MTTDAAFFDQPTDQSLAKASIVAEYFDAWSRVMVRSSDEIQYYDLFAGRGRYEEGTISTPLMILEKAIASEALHEGFHSHLSDANQSFCDQLRQAIGSLPQIDLLKHPPTVECREVGIDTYHELSPRQVPTLYFLDPWGYKGLSVSLMGDTLAGFGCECILFFNFNQINRFISVESQESIMRDLFGVERHTSLSEKLAGLPPRDREEAIVCEMADALRAVGASEVTRFRFTNQEGTRPNHYIIHAAKHHKAREIMADIMAKWSSRADGGVASFEFNPADERQPRLFEDDDELGLLADSLLGQFAGRLEVREVIARHLATRTYTRRNYRAALTLLENSGGISADPPSAERRTGTFSDSVVVTFP